MVSMLETPKSDFKKFALGELFTCAKPSSHDSERKGDLSIESWLYQSAKIILYTLKTLFKLVASVTRQSPQHEQAEAPGHHHLSRYLQQCTSSNIQFFRKYGSKFGVLQPAPPRGMPGHPPTYHATSHFVANSHSIATTCK